MGSFKIRLKQNIFLVKSLGEPVEADLASAQSWIHSVWLIAQYCLVCLLQMKLIFISGHYHYSRTHSKIKNLETLKLVKNV